MRFHLSIFLSVQLLAPMIHNADCFSQVIQRRQQQQYGGLLQEERRRTSPLHQVVPGADIEQDVQPGAGKVIGDDIVYRGKVNEIDYCIAPADASLSRAYAQENNKVNDSPDSANESASNSNRKSMSLTQYLNNASNRAVRRILLARCWPSEQALNLSLRLAAAAEKQAQTDRKSAEASGAKCPIPRPLLNVLMRRDTTSGSSKGPARTNEQYVTDQIESFREQYSALPGYSFAEAYLESVLSLATNGNESPRAKEVLESGVYDESYKRLIAVLKTVGVVVEQNPDADDCRRIAKQLIDQDFCLSMLDKMQIKSSSGVNNGRTNVDSDGDEVEVVAKGKNRRKKFWMKETNAAQSDKTDTEGGDEKKRKSISDVVLAENEPTMTMQLNVLSNIVQRALLFGGDQELLVLSETLDANRKPFVSRWYPKTKGPASDIKDETRPGVQYLNALIAVCRLAYDEGVVTNLEPLTPVIQSYSTAYERLIASLVELGSGYVRPSTTDVMSMPKPRSPTEELGRFAVWESNFRAAGGESAQYPEDLVGSWEVQDEVGGETIGVSTVSLAPQGQVSVEPPLQGLRWRLDPGPTHLDTCTFQVLGEDGTVLQYRGFIDRGARLEARFSKRSTRIRGSVMFQMRDGDVAMSDDYWKDMLPINYKTGTTKFVMTKTAR